MCRKTNLDSQYSQDQIFSNFNKLSKALAKGSSCLRVYSSQTYTKNMLFVSASHLHIIQKPVMVSASIVGTQWFNSIFWKFWIIQHHSQSLNMNTLLMKRNRYNTKLKSFGLATVVPLEKELWLSPFVNIHISFPLIQLLLHKDHWTAQVRQHQYIINRIARQILLRAMSRDNILSACETES